MILFGSPSPPYIAYRPDTIGTYYGLTASGSFYAGDVIGGCVDVNNDGRDDVAISVRARDASPMSTSAISFAGFVRASSGVVAFRSMGGYGGMGLPGLGTSIGLAGDIDGDHIDDVLFNNVTTPTDARIYMYRGTPGTGLSMDGFVTLQSVAPVPAGFGSGVGP